jgi:hypothetical protein
MGTSLIVAGVEVFRGDRAGVAAPLMAQQRMARPQSLV